MDEIENVERRILGEGFRAFECVSSNRTESKWSLDITEFLCAIY